MTVPIVIIIIIIVVIVVLVCVFIKRRRRLAHLQLRTPVVNNTTLKAANTQDTAYPMQLPQDGVYASLPELSPYSTGQYTDPSYMYPTSYPQEPYPTEQPLPAQYLAGGGAPPAYPG